MKLHCTILALLFSSSFATGAPPPFCIVETKGGAHFGICAEKPAKPAPTLIVIAGPPHDDGGGQVAMVYGHGRCVEQARLDFCDA